MSTPPRSCAICGHSTVHYRFWPGVHGDRVVCFADPCESDAVLLHALRIVRDEDGHMHGGPWGSRPPPQGVQSWMERAPLAFRISVDTEIEALRAAWRKEHP